MIMMSATNCPNCGAPYYKLGASCDYCGTPKSYNGLNADDKSIFIDLDYVRSISELLCKGVITMNEARRAIYYDQ